MRLIDADALSELVKEPIDVFLSRLDLKCPPIIDLEPQWIPVTERLPDPEKGTYWVCTDDGGQHECRWTNVNMFWTNLTTDWHWNIFDIPQFTKVVAWMELPKPYREG